MVVNHRQKRNRKVNRRKFIVSIGAAGAGVALAGIVPVAPFALNRREPDLPVDLNIEGEVRPGEDVPILARCQMLSVNSIHFRATRGSVRIDARYRFVDGRLNGGAVFQVSLFDRNGTLVDTQVQTEARRRNMVVQRRASLSTDGADRPNRSGKVEFRFPDTSPMLDIARFELKVWPVE